MISDLTTTGACGTIVPQNESRLAVNPVLSALDRFQPVQPVQDVAGYLELRKPQPEVEGEECLLITLPATLQKEVRALVRACKYVADLVKSKWSVQAACKTALAGVYRAWAWKLNTFRPKYDEWAEQRDWVVLVNLSKAPASWRVVKVGLPEEFLAHCETIFARFGRRDGKRQAVLSIQRHWRVGRDDRGEEYPLPGFETGWNKRDPENLPVGFSYDNICEQLRLRSRFNEATRALVHEGESAAREFLPHNLGTRKGLRFLEKVTFDDVRLDWLVFNPETGQAEECWLLVARDEATALVLGFVMHPASIRADGTATHLGQRQMKELAAYLLERYPLPPYLVHWIVERGTATLAEAVKAALRELFNARIKVHYTSMIGGLSPTGYREKRKGNSRGKASHEAHNRLFHTQGSCVPGQTGAKWDIRPADLEARVKECREIHELSAKLPEGQRGEVKYPLFTLRQARERFQQICAEQNARKEHSLEGFDEIVVEEGGKLVQRLETPIERAMKLIAAVAQWDRVSPDVISTFLEHTQRLVAVNDRGEIEMAVDGTKLVFRSPDAPLNPGTKALAYHHPADPQFIHLTSGDGRVLGTWVQRGRGAFLDQQALGEAMRYTYAARAAAQATAAELAAPERERLEAMRQHNAGLEKFIVVTEAPGATGELRGSSVSAALQSLPAVAKQNKVNPPPMDAEPDSTQELLERSRENQP